MWEIEWEAVRFLYYIISMPSHLYWEVLLCYLKKKIRWMTKFPIRKYKLTCFTYFAWNFLSSIANETYTIQKIWMVLDSFWFLKFTNASFSKPGTFSLKKTHLRRKISPFSASIIEHCYFFSWPRKWKRYQKIHVLAYPFSF